MEEYIFPHNSKTASDIWDPASGSQHLVLMLMLQIMLMLMLMVMLVLMLMLMMMVMAMMGRTSPNSIYKNSRSTDPGGCYW